MVAGTSYAADDIESRVAGEWSAQILRQPPVQDFAKYLSKRIGIIKFKSGSEPIPIEF